VLKNGENAFRSTGFYGGKIVKIFLFFLGQTFFSGNKQNFVKERVRLTS
jgi:hypothetical protein